MRILIVTTDFLPNVSGIATLSYEHASGFSALGHQVRVVTTSSGAADYNNNASFEVREHQNNQPPVIRLKALFTIVAEAIKDWKPDFIWCTNYRGFGLPVMRRATRKGIPYGLYLHGTELVTEHRNPLRRRLFAHIVDNAAIACTNSQNTARLLSEMYGSNAIPVTPGVHVPAEPANGRDKSAEKLREEWFDLKPSPVANRDRLVFTAVCRMSKQKGIQVVLESLALLDPSIRDKILFVAVGSGDDLPFFIQLARELKVADYVIFTGPVDHTKVPSVYGAADVYIQPSQPEGSFLESFGISFLEAQAAGLPCIGSDWGGVPEAVRPGVTALLVPPRSPADVATAISRLIQDGDWRRNASVEGIKWAGQNSWLSHVKTIESHING